MALHMTENNAHWTACRQLSDTYRRCVYFSFGHRLTGSRQLTLTVPVLVVVSELSNLLLQSAPAMLLA